ncbi:MAG: 5-(carboxyamino)imidazole ribonucleotide synthase [Sphingopyxis sp.]
MAPLPPGSIIGILGGGQLGRMLAVAAAQIGYRTHIYAPEADGVAGDVATHRTIAAYDDESALNAFAQSVDVVTFEFENVPVDCARHLAPHRPVYPPVQSLQVAQDRLREKAFARDLGIAVAPFAPVTSEAELLAAIETIGCPAILKTATDGYDGKGQGRITNPADALAVWDALGRRRAILEQMVDFSAEFSVIIARTIDGQFARWDCPRNVHDDGILAQSVVPAGPAIAPQQDAAVDAACRLADALGHVGVLACEFFATDAGPMFNEMAPRVHNSGHWTVEGATTSQFENHIRAVCGLPLGSTALTGASVEMRNIIGADVDRWLDYLADPQCHLHLYGKGHGRAGRKMGHATWVRRAAPTGQGAA